jgi:branched-chain amino acid transport system ATP-binding protein
MNHEYFLQVRNIDKSFGGLKALNQVSIDVKRNTIHGIIGPNGAGKTTLFNAITCQSPQDSGDVIIEGKTVRRLKSHRLVKLGVARTFQNLRLFENMTVIENVLIGQHVHQPTPVLSILLNGSRAKEGERLARGEAMQALCYVDLEDDADSIVAGLPYAKKRLIEFARALAAKPRCILLDEPAAGMNPTEKTYLMSLINKLKEEGYTIILIEHDMKLVMGVCDIVTVLDHGSVIAEGRPQEVRINPEVITAYLGKGGLKYAED